MKPDCTCRDVIDMEQYNRTVSEIKIMWFIGIFQERNVGCI